eukprot:5669425-Amphidinium_carterae.1
MRTADRVSLEHSFLFKGPCLDRGASSCKEGGLCYNPKFALCKETSCSEGVVGGGILFTKEPQDSRTSLYGLLRGFSI